MEDLVSMSYRDFYRGKRVLVTGHTGFKGSWLCEWLLDLGAQVTGLALAPKDVALFDQLALARRMRHIVGDVRDAGAVTRVISEARPQIVFHLAAQPLVRLSYEIPVETYATNIMGTVHVLDALRLVREPCTAVMVTTDKCYENREWVFGYREDDPLGGYDPYSSSKGAAELVISAYRRSYFSRPDSFVRLASARAGNVIGGGDWAMDRIVPDCMRQLAKGEVVRVRNKTATRPWQHVLEPLSGYLRLAAHLASEASSPSPLASAFNFGPGLSSNQTVAQLVEEILINWSGTWQDCSDPNAPHEAGKLNLSTDKAYHLLDWRPVLDFPSTVALTAEWYREAHHRPGSEHELTRNQIDRYVLAARSNE